VVQIPRGTFTMGHDGDDAVPGDCEGSARPVTLDRFRIGPTAVTNAASPPSCARRATSRCRARMGNIGFRVVAL